MPSPRRQWINLAEAIRQVETTPGRGRLHLATAVAEEVQRRGIDLVPQESLDAFNRERFITHATSTYDGTPPWDGEAWTYVDADGNTVRLVRGNGVQVGEPVSS